MPEKKSRHCYCGVPSVFALRASPYPEHSWSNASARSKKRTEKLMIWCISFIGFTEDARKIIKGEMWRFDLSKNVIPWWI
jgi:hypothetical protein